MHDENIEPVRRSVEVGCSPSEAFRLFTEEIESWWPLAAHSVGKAKAVGCVFEGRDGGRVYETLVDGTLHLWGTATVWEPPHRVVFSWHPGREASTAQEVELRFLDNGNGSRVELEHRGWETLGERAAEVRDNYETGWVAVLSLYADHCAKT